MTVSKLKKKKKFYLRYVADRLSKEVVKNKLNP